MHEHPISRRALLRTAALAAGGAGAMALVGCGSDDDAKPTPTATPPTATAAPSTPASTSTPPRPLSWRMLPASGPSARRDHSLTYDPDARRIYLFGGRARGVASNDLWALDIGAGVWTEVTVAGARPGERFGHNALYDASKKRLVVTLGQQDSSNFYNDVWAFDPATGAWSELGASGDRPEVRYGAGAAHDVEGNRLLVSHGFTDRGRFDDTWTFGLADDRWTKLTTKGAVPIKRCLTRCLWLPADERMLLYGGQTDDNPFLGDTWLLDETKGWSEQKPDPSPGPRNLYGASLDKSGARWYIVGGNTPDGPNADTWVYDMASAAWGKVEAIAAPPARYSADTAVAESTLILFGGHDGTTELADTWMTCVDARTPSRCQRA